MPKHLFKLNQETLSYEDAWACSSSLLSDVSKSQIELEKQARFDVITGLPSLHYLQQHADNYLAKAKRQDQQIAVMFLGLYGFKSVNDN